MKTTLRRGVLPAVLVLAVAALAPIPSGATHCLGLGSAGQAYEYCGEHLDDSSLPIVVHPPSSSAAWVNATAAAALAWVGVFPAAPSGCAAGQLPATTTVFCIALTTKSASTSDGETSVTLTTAKPWCVPTAGDWAAAVAVTCRTFSGGHITDADVYLNNAYTWRFANAVEVSAGEAAALGGSLGAQILGESWYDIQAVITHELGHVIGLRDLYGVSGTNNCGSPTFGYPGDLSAAANYRQTMYGCQWPGAANKRTLEEGDIAGAIRAAADTTGHIH